MKNTIEVTYKDLKKGDVIYFHGALVRLVDYRVEGNAEYEPYRSRGEKVIRFDIEPYNEETIKILGKFYSTGTYGGVDSLKAYKLIEEIAE